MSTEFSPITLTVTDSNGNTVGTATIDQSIADALYSYYVQKLEQDQTFVEAIAQGIVNDQAAFETLYKAIKERLDKERQAQLQATLQNQAKQYQQLTAQIMQMYMTILPITMLAQAFQPRSGLEHVLEAVIPLFILLPLIDKIK